MTEQMTDSDTHPRRLLRSTAAIFSGFVAVFVLSLGTDEIFHVLQIYPPWEQPMFDTGLLLLALTYRIIYGIAGGYVTARLAPHAPMRHAVILGGFGFLASTAGGAAMWNMGAHWYPVALAISSIPCSWAGGALCLKLHHEK